jgi:cardiolipin synthase
MTLQTLLELLALALPLIHGVGILFAIHAIIFARTSTGAVAWALSLIFFPYVSIILYLVFGRQKFHGYIEARRAGDRDIDHLADHLAQSLQPHRLPLTGDNQRFHAFEQLSLFPFTTGNSAQLLIDGAATFDAIFHAIDNARSYLLVQFFIIRNDSLGNKLVSRLAEKARQGLHVYLLYDEIGCYRLPAGFFNPIRHNGGKVHAFNSSQGLRHRFQINFRNHRKIVIADGTAAFVGGLNVGNEYLGLSSFGPWRDTHVQLQGPAVATVQWAFLEDWYWATSQILDLPTPPLCASVPQSLSASPAQDSSTQHSVLSPQSSALALHTGPSDDFPSCTMMFLTAISAARTRLWITSPYFVPEESIYDAIQLAALRGVDVRIMLPSKPDHILVYLSSFSYLRSAEAVGVKFYRYQAGFLHQKVLLVDDDFAAVGTANLDNRSTRLNFELTLLFLDKPFAAQVAAMLERDFQYSHRASPGDLARRPILFRIAVRIARLLSPVQ